MKNILMYIFAAVLLMTGMGSCYDDKGNYDYKDILEIGVKGIPSSFSCYTLLDTLRFTPEVGPEGVDYEYTWVVVPEGATMGTAQSDTVSTEKNLEYIVRQAAGSYILAFVVKDKQTGISEFVESKMTVTTALSSGWYVLRTQDGHTDLDLYSDRGKAENVIAANNGGRTLSGNANCILQTSRYWALNQKFGRYMPTNVLMASSDNDLAILYLADGKIARDMNTLFYEKPETLRPQKLMVGGFSDQFMINDGQLYYIYGMTPNSGRFGVPKAGNYRLASNCVAMGQSPLFFDELSSSFCIGDAVGSTLTYFGDDGEIDVNNMDADLLFMGPAVKGTAWALMQSTDDNQQFLLHLNADFGWGNPGNPVLSKKVLNQGGNMGTADMWASNSRNNIIYFVKDNRIYSCNIDAGMTEKEQQVLPVGVEVTYMKHLVYSVWNKPEKSFEVLAVAVSEGSDYTVFLYDIQAGNLQNNPRTLEGHGRVGAMIYVDGSNSTMLY